MLVWQNKKTQVKSFVHLYKGGRGQGDRVPLSPPQRRNPFPVANSQSLATVKRTKARKSVKVCGASWKRARRSRLANFSHRRQAGRGSHKLRTISHICRVGLPLCFLFTQQPLWPLSVCGAPAKGETIWAGDTTNPNAKQGVYPAPNVSPFAIPFPFTPPSLPCFTFWIGDIVLISIVRLITFVALLLAVVELVSLIFYSPFHFIQPSLPCFTFKWNEKNEY